MNNNQEMLFNIIALQNENKLLKEKNKEQQKQIDDLKQNAIIKTKLDTLYTEDLKFRNVNMDNKTAILINEKSWQYGPYKKYQEGKYCIVYYGNNLHELIYDCCDNKGKNKLNISKIFEFSNKVAYNVFLPKNNNCIEFRARGKEKNFLLLNGKKIKGNLFQRLKKKSIEGKLSANLKKKIVFSNDCESKIEKIEVYRYNIY
jgi:hypothetical protein